MKNLSSKNKPSYCLQVNFPSGNFPDTNQYKEKPDESTVIAYLEEKRVIQAIEKTFGITQKNEKYSFHIRQGFHFPKENKPFSIDHGFGMQHLLARPERLAKLKENFHAKNDSQCIVYFLRQVAKLANEYEKEPSQDIFIFHDSYTGYLDIALKIKIENQNHFYILAFCLEDNQLYVITLIKVSERKFSLLRSSSRYLDLMQAGEDKEEDKKNGFTPAFFAPPKISDINFVEQTIENKIPTKPMLNLEEEKKFFDLVGTLYSYLQAIDEIGVFLLEDVDMKTLKTLGLVPEMNVIKKTVKFNPELSLCHNQIKFSLNLIQDLIKQYKTFLAVYSKDVERIASLVKQLKEINQEPKMNNRIARVRINQNVFTQSSYDIAELRDESVKMEHKFSYLLYYFDGNTGYFLRDLAGKNKTSKNQATDHNLFPLLSSEWLSSDLPDLKDSWLKKGWNQEEVNEATALLHTCKIYQELSLKQIPLREKFNQLLEQWIEAYDHIAFEWVTLSLNLLGEAVEHGMEVGQIHSDCPELIKFAYNYLALEKSKTTQKAYMNSPTPYKLEKASKVLQMLPELETAYENYLKMLKAPIKTNLKI